MTPIVREVRRWRKMFGITCQTPHVFSLFRYMISGLAQKSKNILISESCPRLENVAYWIIDATGFRAIGFRTSSGASLDTFCLHLTITFEENRFRYVDEKLFGLFNDSSSTKCLNLRGNHFTEIPEQTENHSSLFLNSLKEKRNPRRNWMIQTNITQKKMKNFCMEWWMKMMLMVTKKLQ